jgi:predicted branched-subunit amino acid permease
LWFNAVICTILGFSISHLVSHEFLIGLVFINPIYFLIMTVSNLNEKKLTTSVILGAVFSVVLYQYTPEWSVLIAGIASGTLGFFIFKKENNDS